MLLSIVSGTLERPRFDVKSLNIERSRIERLGEGELQAGLGGVKTDWQVHGLFSMSDAAIVVGSLPREMSRTTTLPFVRSIKSGARDFPSAVMTVTDSNPLRMTFDGRSTDSTSDSSLASTRRHLLSL